MVSPKRIQQVVCLAARLAPTASGVVLLIALIGKTVSWWYEPNYNSLILGSTSLTLFVLHFEGLIAIALLLSNSLMAVRGAIGLHLMFLAYGIYSLFDTSKSCRCFGHWTPSVEVMILVNISIVTAFGLLAYFRLPQFRLAILPQGQRWFVALCLGMTLSAGICYNMLRMNDSSVEICEGLSNGELTILRSKEWQGTLLPILDCIENAPPEISQGECTVLIYSRNCDDCRRLLATHTDTPRSRIGFIAIDLEGSFTNGIRLLHSEFAISRVPTILKLRNGIVEEVFDPDQLQFATSRMLP